MLKDAVIIKNGVILDNMGKNYQSILEKLKKSPFAENNLEVFSAQIGTACRNGIMVVGRAVNDWKPFVPSKTDTFDLSDNQWPEDDIENFFRGCEYNINRSAFWRVCRSTAKSLFPEMQNHWGQWLIYSDLYKVALPKSNPDSALIQLQQAECIDILQEEIQRWRPRYILFLTGRAWVKPFLDAYLKNGNITPQTPSGLLEECGQFPASDSSYVVISHPQGKQEKALIKDTIRFFLGIPDRIQELNGIFGELKEKKDRLDCTEFELPGNFSYQNIPLEFYLQLDWNKKCFRFGIWQRNPAVSLLAAGLRNYFPDLQENSAWRGGYIELPLYQGDQLAEKMVSFVEKMKQECQRVGA